MVMEMEMGTGMKVTMEQEEECKHCRADKTYLADGSLSFRS